MYLFPLNNSVIDLAKAHPFPAGHVQAVPCCGLLFLKFNGPSMRILLLEIINIYLLKFLSSILGRSDLPSVSLAAFYQLTVM